jgi:hypothetical protein
MGYRLNHKSRLRLPALVKEEEKRYYPNRPNGIKSARNLLDDYPPIAPQLTLNFPTIHLYPTYSPYAKPILNKNSLFFPLILIGFEAFAHLIETGCLLRSTLRIRHTQTL